MWIQFRIPKKPMMHGLKKSFKDPSIIKKFNKFANKQNPKRTSKKTCVFRLPGPSVDDVVINYPRWGVYMDHALADKYKMKKFFSMVIDDNTDLSEFVDVYVLATCHLAIDLDLHFLWQKYFRILHIPQFYPKTQYPNEMPPELDESEVLSVKIFDKMERLQPHGVYLHFVSLFVCFVAEK